MLNPAAPNTFVLTPSSIRDTNCSASIQNGLLWLEDGTTIDLAALVDLAYRLKTTKMPDSNDEEHDLLADLMSKGADALNGRREVVTADSATPHPLTAEFIKAFSGRRPVVEGDDAQASVTVQSECGKTLRAELVRDEPTSSSSAKRTIATYIVTIEDAAEHGLPHVERKESGFSIGEGQDLRDVLGSLFHGGQMAAFIASALDATLSGESEPEPLRDRG